MFLIRSKWVNLFSDKKAIRKITLNEAKSKNNKKKLQECENRKNIRYKLVANYEIVIETKNYLKLKILVFY